MKKVLIDRETGEEIRILKTAEDTNGEYLEFDNFIPAGLGGPPSHAHPRQDERFEVLEGQLKVCVDGQWQGLTPGETAEVPAGTFHTFTNIDQPDLLMRVRLSPALDADELYDGLLGLGMQRSKTLALFRLAQIMTRLESWFYLQAPRRMQRLAFYVLAPIGRLCGVSYPKASRRHAE